MKKSRNKIIVTASVLIAVLLIITLFTTFSLGKKKSKLPAVTTTDVAMHNIKETLDTSGTVKSNQTMTYFSPVNAPIAEMKVQVGDTVNKGAKLVTFDLSTLEADNQKAALNVTSSELTYKDSVSKADEGADKVAEAKDKVTSLTAQLAEKEQAVSDLTASIEQAKGTAASEAAAQTQAANADYENQLKEAKDRAAQAQKTYDAAKTNYDIAFSKLNAAADAASDTASANGGTKGTESGTAAGGTTAGSGSAGESASGSAGSTSVSGSAAGNGSTDAVSASAGAASTTTTGNTATKAGAADTAAAEAKVKALSDTLSSAKTALDAAKAAQSELEAAPPQAQEGSADTSGLEAQLAAAQNDLATLSSDLEAARQLSEADTEGMSDAGKQQLQTQTNLSELEKKSSDELIAEGKKGITAAFNGVISDAQVVKGATATQGLELCTLASTDDVSVEISVSKYDFGKLSIGQKADITLADSTYTGTIDKINHIAVPNDKGTPMVGARIHIDNPDKNIFLGVEAKVTVECKNLSDAPSVPTEAVNVNKDGSFCYIIKNGKLKKQPIEKGAASTSYIEIKKGLKNGAAVVVDPGDAEEGDAVRANRKD